MLTSRQFARLLSLATALWQPPYPRAAESASAFHAADCGATLPSAVSAFVRSEARHGWIVVTLNDLVADDQALWSRSHAGQCPGIAVGRFDGTAADSYAIALVRRGGRVGHYVEQLVLLRPSGSTYSHVVVNGPARVVSPLVVWSLPPGTYAGSGDGLRVTIGTDSFVYEKLEASAVQYYLVGGQLHSLVTGD